MIISYIFEDSLLLPSPGQRLVIVGSPGAGKTTLARQLFQMLRLPHIELDALYWGADWIPTPAFCQRTAQAISRQAWIVEGNHDRVADLVWRRADTLIWLDLSLAVLMMRLMTRTLGNLLTKTELWHGNRERWRRTFLTPNSIFIKLAGSYHEKRQSYLKRLSQPPYQHLRLIHLRSPEAVQRWLAGLNPQRRQARPFGASLYASL